MVREVSESCVDIMIMEMVVAYYGRFYAKKQEIYTMQIKEIGYQVGLQLAEW